MLYHGREVMETLGHKMLFLAGDSKVIQDTPQLQLSYIGSLTNLLHGRIAPTLSLKPMLHDTKLLSIFLNSQA